MKKLIGLLLVAALALGLAACVVEPEDPNVVPEVTTSEGEKNTDPNALPVTTKEPVVTDPPVEVTVASTPAPSTGSSAKPVPSTAAPKAKLYPASALYKALKSGKFYMEYTVTDSASSKTQTFVRTSDGKKQYVRASLDGTSFALLKDDENLNFMLPASLITADVNAAVAALLKPIIGSTGGYLPLPLSGLAEEGSETITELDSMFKAFDEIFLNPGKFQKASVSTGKDGTKYNVETFKNDNVTTKFYFVQDDIKLVQKSGTDDAYSLVNIISMKSSADTQYLTVPKSYVKLDEEKLKTISKLLDMVGG
ncbi:MAG: hypothetical protein LBT21_07280 [Oscillospiraceae bacterium]|jgi:hypothetical protein|nr:hypothetical protein [Oscillospiraceae bacterium]